MTTETTLIDDLVGGCPRPVNRCKVGAILDQLDPVAAHGLAGALAERDWSTAALSGILAKHGYRVSASTLATHRRADCACTA